MSILSLKKRLDKLNKKSGSNGIEWHIQKKMHRVTNGRYPMPKGEPPRIISSEELQERISAGLKLAKKSGSQIVTIEL